MTTPLPAAVAPLVGFAWLLRRHDFGVTFEQTKTFLAAVGLLGPSTFEAIHAAAHACFAPAYDRRGEFEALFRAHFYDDAVGVPQPRDEEEARVAPSTQERDGTSGEMRSAESGRSATATELLFAREFGAEDSAVTRRRLRYLADHLPQRRSFRMAPVARGRSIDLSRSLTNMLRHDGDVPEPVYRIRRTRPRRVLMLIDISGSMKRHTREHLILAHLLGRALQKLEVFTVGTRLTQISDAIAHRHEAAALAAVAEQVADWDGGTRLGPGLSAFIAVPRYINFARGAAVLILSDGLERGDPAPLLLAVQRLHRVAWRLSWASPLAADPVYRPETNAMRQILPHLDDLVDGGSLTALVDFVLRLAVPESMAMQKWENRRSA
jgi:uncharacterized protein with von Willebrand factor type A (vWA) domain